MVEWNILLFSSFSLILFASSFCKDMFYAYGLNPIHDGELDAYLPLFRVFLTLFISLLYLHNNLSRAFFVAFQAVTTGICYNFDNSVFFSELLQKSFAFGLSKETHLMLIETIPLLCLWVLVAYVDQENKPISWEPVLPNATDVSGKIDEVKEVLRAKTKEKIQNAQKVMEEQKLEFGNAVKKKIKEAEKFYDDHQKEIESSLIPEALSEKTIGVVEEDKLSVSSIDSNGPRKPAAATTKKSKTQLAREQAYRKQQERVKKRLAELKRK